MFFFASLKSFNQCKQTKTFNAKLPTRALSERKKKLHTHINSCVKKNTHMDRL